MVKSEKVKFIPKVISGKPVFDPNEFHGTDDVRSKVRIRPYSEENAHFVRQMMMNYVCWQESAGFGEKLVAYLETIHDKTNPERPDFARNIRRTNPVPRTAIESWGGVLGVPRTGWIAPEKMLQELTYSEKGRLKIGGPMAVERILFELWAADSELYNDNLDIRQVFGLSPIVNYELADAVQPEQRETITLSGRQAKSATPQDLALAEAALRQQHEQEMAALRKENAQLQARVAKLEAVKPEVTEKPVVVADEAVTESLRRARELLNMNGLEPDDDYGDMMDDIDQNHHETMEQFIGVNKVLIEMSAENQSLKKELVAIRALVENLTSVVDVQTDALATLAQPRRPARQHHRSVATT